MRYLGIDYGTKRIGLAWSDQSGRMAFPHSILKNDSNAKDELIKFIKKEIIGAAVIGDSRDLQGKENLFMPEARAFMKYVEEKSEVPVHWIPEQFTTVQATRLQGVNIMKDASAAAIILQTYLDRINPKENDGENEDEEYWT